MLFFPDKAVVSIDQNKNKKDIRILLINDFLCFYSYTLWKKYIHNITEIKYLLILKEKHDTIHYLFIKLHNIFFNF